MQQESPTSTDIGLGVVLILVALVIIYGTLDLPAGSFEPLGSASIPQYVCGGIIVLSIWIIARALVRSRQRGGQPEANGADEATFPLRPGIAIALVGFAFVYVGVMATDLLRFSIATTLFLVAAIGMLTKFERRQIPAVVIVALVLGIGLEYTFTQIFVIDLP
jgi:putative tricarboxylic transport membrane protein